MQARLSIRPVLLPQSCVGGANVPSLWQTSATLQDCCQCYSAPIDRMLTQHGRNPRASPSPHTGGTPCVLAERHAHPPVSQSTASLTAKRRGRGGFRIFDVVDVATGEVCRDGGHFVEVLKAQGLQGMRPLFVVADLQKPRKSGRRSGQVRTFAAFTRVCS